jgi:hypothetical protein
VKNLLLLSIGIFFVTLGIGLIYNEYSFRRKAVAVAGRAAGFKRSNDFFYSTSIYRQEVIFTCPFTQKKRRETSRMGSERQQEHVPNTTVNVYVSPEPPHRYRVGSPMYLLGSSVIAIGIIWLAATYFR